MRIHTFQLCLHVLSTIACVATFTTVGSAANVALTDGNAYEEDWFLGSDWSNGASASSGNDYYVDPGNRSGLFDGINVSQGGTLRSPHLDSTANSVFPGDTLTIFSGGALALKPALNQDVTVNNLVSDGGWINVANNWAMGLAGSLDVLSGGVQFSGAAPLEVSSTLTGLGRIEIRNTSNFSGAFPLSFTSTSSTWKGDFSNLDTNSNVAVSFATSIDFGEIDLGPGSINLNGQNHTTDQLIINGLPLPKGNYSGGDWSGILGSGTIEVLIGGPSIGDVNLDHLVDEADHAIIRANLFKAVGSRGEGDLNGDGIVNFADYGLWKNDPARIDLSLATPAPEPGALVCLLTLAWGAWLRQVPWRRRTCLAHVTLARRF